MLNLDLTNVFEIGLRDLYDSSRRGDEHLPHVSHLGKCLLQTRLSRARAPKIETQTRGYQFMMKGLHDEEYIIGVLSRGLENTDWYIANATIDEDLTGHVDVELLNTVTAEGAIIEIKTTQWYEKWEHLGEIGKRGLPIKTKMLPGPRPEVTDIHRFQALGYALRRGLRWYAVFQWDRALHGFHQYPNPGEWFDSQDADWLQRHNAWTRQVIDLTDPTTDPVEMGIATVNAEGQLVGSPPDAWMCGYCDYSQCANNTNKNNAEHVIEEVVF